MKKKLLAVLFLFFAVSVHSQANWIGGTDNNWHTAANWDTGAVPGVTTDVTIPGTATVNISSNVSVRSINVTGTNPSLGDNLVLDANLSVTEASHLGQLDWMSGKISGGAAAIQGSTTQISGTGAKSIASGTSLSLGVVYGNGTGTLSLTNCELNILELIISADFAILPLSSTTETLTITNWIIMSGANATGTINCRLVCNGLVNVANGTLNINSPNALFNGGPISRFLVGAPSGTALNLSGNLTFSGTFPCTLSNPMTINGTINIAGTTTFNPLGSGTSGISWNGGTLTGGGTFNTNVQFNCVGSANKTISGGITINNGGTFNIADTGVVYLISSALNNQPTGYINFTGNQSLTTNNSSVDELFYNAGTINRPISSGTAKISCRFQNVGTINVNEGTLEITTPNCEFIGGQYNVAAGATLLCSGAVDFSGTMSGTLEGDFILDDFHVPTAATFNFAGSTGMNWSSGSLDGGGTLTNIGIMNILGSSPKTIAENTTLANAGVFNVKGSGLFYLVDGTFYNMPAGTVNFEENNTVLTVGASTSEVFINEGSISRAGIPGTTAISCKFENSGTINVNGGTMQLTAQDDVFDGGILNVASGASLNVTGNVFCSGTLTGVIAGSFNSTGSITVTDAFALDLDGNGMNWMGGSIKGGGTFSNLKTINIQDISAKNLTENTTFNNAGTINNTGTGFWYLTNSVLNNLPSGTINLPEDAIILAFAGSDSERLNNAGTINRTTSGGTAKITCRFTNSGTINVTAGQLEITGAHNEFNGGFYNTSAGSTLFCTGTITCSGELTGTIHGTFSFNGTLTVPDSAALNFSGSEPAIWAEGLINGGGTLTNNGNLSLAGADPKTINASTTLNNAGTITLENAQFWYVTNATVNNLADGLIDIASDGANITYTASTIHNLNNSGTVIKSAGSGTSQLSLTTLNTGMIDIQSGTLNMGNSVLDNDASGTIGGIGTLTLPSAANLTNDGTFAPGGTPGKLSVTGSYESTASSIIAVDIFGPTQQTEYDLLAITGNGQFNGTVMVALGFVPDIGDEFVVATTAGTISQCSLESTTTANYNGSDYTFDVTCRNNNELVLTLSQVALGVDDNSVEGLVLSPNPATNVITLQSAATELLISATIVDFSGRVLQRIDLTDMQGQQTIALDGLTSGTYLMKIDARSGSTVKKFVVR